MRVILLFFCGPSDCAIKVDSGYEGAIDILKKDAIQAMMET